MSILPFLQDRSALLAYQQRAEVDCIYKSMLSSKACDVFIFVESRNLNLYLFSFCSLENNSKFGQNYDNDICCWSRIFSTQITNHLHNAKAKLGNIAEFIEFAANSQSESKAWKHCWLCKICCKFWVLNFFFKIERDTAN